MDLRECRQVHDQVLGLTKRTMSQTELISSSDSHCIIRWLDVDKANFALGGKYRLLVQMRPQQIINNLPCNNTKKSFSSTDNCTKNFKNS